METESFQRQEMVEVGCLHAEVDTPAKWDNGGKIFGSAPHTTVWVTPIIVLSQIPEKGKISENKEPSPHEVSLPIVRLPSSSDLQIRTKMWSQRYRDQRRKQALPYRGGNPEA